MRIAVAGGGIAGLTAAIALAARGFSIDLYERAPAIAEIGAGIQLSPNGMAVLERLGVAAALEGRLVEPEALAVRDGTTGALLARMPLGRTMRERYGAPYCTMRRADLQAALLGVAEAESRITLHLDAPVGDVSETMGHVHFAAGADKRQADLLIAADGVRSAVRSAFFRHPPAISFGRSAWRATLSAEEASRHASFSEVGLWLAGGAHLVHYPVAAGAGLNVVVIGAGAAADPPRAAFGTAARKLLDAVPAWNVTPLVGIDHSHAWTRGRIALIGDAAHAMAPSAAQGGVQALEDAWVVAAVLAAAPSDPAGALARYARLRTPRVARVARLGMDNLNIYELSGVSAAARNSLLRALPARFMLWRLDWLFSWTPQQN